MMEALEMIGADVSPTLTEWKAMPNIVRRMMTSVRSWTKELEAEAIEDARRAAALNAHRR